MPIYYIALDCGSAQFSSRFGMINYLEWTYIKQQNELQTNQWNGKFRFDWYKRHKSAIFACSFVSLGDFCLNSMTIETLLPHKDLRVAKSFVVIYSDEMYLRLENFCEFVNKRDHFIANEQICHQNWLGFWGIYTSINLGSIESMKILPILFSWENNGTKLGTSYA